MRKLLKLSFLHLRDHFVSSLFLVIIMSLSLISFINAVGQIQYAKYSLDIYQESNLQTADYVMPNFFNGQLGADIVARNKIIDEFHAKLKAIDGVTEVVYEKYIVCGLQDQIIKEGMNSGISMINSDFFNAIDLRTSSGDWLNKSKQSLDDNVIDTVVSGASLSTKYNVGDLVDVDILNYKTKESVGSIKLRIIGILEYPGYLVQFNVQSTKLNASQLFRMNNRFIIKENSRVMEMFAGESGVNYQQSANCFVFYANEEKRATAVEKVKELGTICTKEQLIDNSKEATRKIIIQKLPLTIFMLIVSALSFVSVATVTIYKKLNEYMIYYICGSSWKRCFLYAAISIGILGLISFGIANGYIEAVNFIRKHVDAYFMTSEKDSAIFNCTTRLYVALYLSITTMVSLIIPYLVFKKDSPIELYRRMK